MMMWNSLACLACIIGVAQLTMLPGRTWRRKTSGYVSEDGYTYKGHVRGTVDCSRVCSKLSCTKSYFYNDDTRVCQCHDSIYTGAEASLLTVPNVRYYEEVIEVIDLANMTKLPCPCDASVATDVVRSGVSLFRVRAFLDTARSFDDSQAKCVAHGGLLYKATTMEKFDLAHQLMTHCPAYMSRDYWGNGKDYTNTGVYETTDRELIQMPAEVWAPGKPGSSWYHCIWMRAMDGHLWDDTNCNQNLTKFPTYAFCEIPQ